MRARMVVTHLRRMGWTVWWDQDILPGTRFTNAIQQALGAARAIVVLWSRISVKSEWVVDEAYQALERKILIPLLLEENVELPFMFARVQAANLSDWDGNDDHQGFAKFVEALRLAVKPHELRESPAAVAPVRHTVSKRQRVKRAGASLLIEVVDVYGHQVVDTIDVFLEHTDSRVRSKVERVRGDRPILVSGLQPGRYNVLVYPRRYRPSALFCRAEAGDLKERLIVAVDPASVRRVTFPAYSSLPGGLRSLLERSQLADTRSASGRELYRSMEVLRKATLFNVFAKAQETVLSNGRNVCAYWSSLVEARRDRVLMRADRSLPDDVAASVPYGTFQEVSGALHTAPPGFGQRGAFKTLDAYAALQLTLFESEDGRVLVDADLDDSAGIRHFFRSVGEAARATGLHPYDIHQLLLGYQRIDPGYRITGAPRTRRAGADADAESGLEAVARHMGDGNEAARRSAE